MLSLALPVIALVAGFILLVWSADRFVDGAAATARHAGMPLLLVGLVVVGFGTSAPEMIISAISAYQGNPGLALGNAYGSNIANIALILGLTAVITPIAVSPKILRTELPVLAAITLLTFVMLWNLSISRFDAVILLLAFAGVMLWWIMTGLRHRSSSPVAEVIVASEIESMSLKSAIIWLIVGLALLVLSSRLLVWGAVAIAHAFGVSDLIIGLTIVALGTSLPELASAIAATRKGAHDLVLGNVIGSNIFNTLAVVGIAGVIHPLDIGAEVLYRDCLLMGLLTLVLFFSGVGRKYRISRSAGAGLLMVYMSYSGYLIMKVLGVL